MLNVRRILYATDFSSYSNQAYFHAVALAEHHRAELIIAHVYVPHGLQPGGDEEAAERQHRRGQLEGIRPADPGIAARHAFLIGDPAEQILRCAAEQGADLIVMGTHGRTGLQRLLMGSVAETVLRGAACSVLVVKMPRGLPDPPSGESDAHSSG